MANGRSKPDAIDQAEEATTGVEVPRDV